MTSERHELDEAFAAFENESTPLNYDRLIAARKAYDAVVMVPQLTQKELDYHRGVTARHIYASRRW